MKLNVQSEYKIGDIYETLEPSGKPGLCRRVPNRVTDVRPVALQHPRLGLISAYAITLEEINE